jgi:hypothetical protein
MTSAKYQIAIMAISTVQPYQWSLRRCVPQNHTDVVVKWETLRVFTGDVGY